MSKDSPGFLLTICANKVWAYHDHIVFINDFENILVRFETACGEQPASRVHDSGYSFVVDNVDGRAVEYEGICGRGRALQ